MKEVNDLIFILDICYIDTEKCSMDYLNVVGRVVVHRRMLLLIRLDTFIAYHAYHVLVRQTQD